jgi:hypothetical protein
MHGTLAVTAAHDRYLGLPSTSSRFVREVYHWSRCTTLFNEWLSSPIKEEHKDPLWAAAGSLAAVTWSPSGSYSLEQAWPLGPSNASDLEWIRLSAGKVALRHLVDPARPSSVFHTLFESFPDAHAPLKSKGTNGLSTKLIELCGLDDSSTAGNNAYFCVVHSLSRVLQDAAEGKASQHRVMMVLSHMGCQFESRLRAKDPIALVLLCLWYSEARKSTWWIDFRARYEVPAIHTYLRRYHKGNVAVHALIHGNTATDFI